MSIRVGGILRSRFIFGGLNSCIIRINFIFESTLPDLGFRRSLVCSYAPSSGFRWLSFLAPVEPQVFHAPFGACLGLLVSKVRHRSPDLVPPAGSGDSRNVGFHAHFLDFSVVFLFVGPLPWAKKVQIDPNPCAIIAFWCGRILNLDL